MSYYRDTETCPEHGFVLSPERTCIRCQNEARRVARQRRLVTLVGGGLFAGVTLLGIVIAHARARPGETRPVAAASTPDLFPDPLPDVPPGRKHDRPSVATAAPLHDPNEDEWKASLARANAQRAADEAARVAAARRRIDENLGPVPVVVVDRPARAPDPPQQASSMWDEPRPRRMLRSSYPRGGPAGASGLPGNVTNSNPGAWLPPNSGGNFGSHGAGP